MIILLSGGIQSHCVRWRFLYPALEFISSTSRPQYSSQQDAPQLQWAHLSGLPCYRKLCSSSCTWVLCWKGILSFQARYLAIGPQFFWFQSMGLGTIFLFCSVSMLFAYWLFASWCLWLILTPYIENSLGTDGLERPFTVVGRDRYNTFWGNNSWLPRSPNPKFA